MYDLILTFVSFIFAVAATHLLTSATNLILARKRVIFSGLLLLWMTTSLLDLLVNWLGMAGLRNLHHWTPQVVLIIFAATLVEYFTCSLLAIDVEKSGPVDMVGFFEEHRRVIMGALATLVLLACAWNYVLRDFNGMSASAWLQQDAILLAATPMLGVAAFARSKLLQWAAAIILFVVTLVFFLQFTFGS